LKIVALVTCVQDIRMPSGRCDAAAVSEGRHDVGVSGGSRLRIAFAGAGAVATRHAAALGTFDDVQVVAVADPLTERAEALAAGWGAAVHRDVDDMVQRTRPDALYICVPPFAHGPPEAAAIDAGVPFFVEKPLACDLETAETIAAAVARRGLVTATGYHWRYFDTVERAAELLVDRPARLAIGSWLDKVPPPLWWSTRANSGGQVIEQATHVLDLARVLVGDVAEVSALAARTPRTAYPDADVDDVSVATLRFRSGAVGTLAATCLLQWKHHAALQLFADGLALELSESDLVVDTGSGAVRETPQIDAKTRSDRVFLDAVRGGDNQVRTAYAEALETHRVACAVARSAEQRRPVALGGDHG
jgi:predicted dehydrogenase